MHLVDKEELHKRERGWMCFHQTAFIYYNFIQNYNGIQINTEVERNQYSEEVLGHENFLFIRNKIQRKCRKPDKNSLLFVLFEERTQRIEGYCVI